MEPKLLMMSYTPTNKHTTGQHATFWEIFKSVLSQTWQVTGQGHLLGTSLGLRRFRMLYTSIRNSLEGRLWERCNVKSVRKNLIFFIVSIQDYVCTRQIAFTLNSYTHRNLIQGHYTSVAHRHSMGEVWGRQGQMKKKNAPDWDLHTDLLQSWSWFKVTVRPLPLGSVWVKINKSGPRQSQMYLSNDLTQISCNCHHLDLGPKTLSQGHCILLLL